MPSNRDIRKIKKLATSIQNNIDSLHRNTYYDDPSINNDVDELTRKINDNIDRIVRHNMNTAGVPSVSKLYSRLDLDNKLKPSVNGTTGLDSLFTDVAGFEDFYANFMQNRYLRELDDEIDAVCKYFPDLLEALEIKKEGVLSADHFSKDFLTITSSGVLDETTFAERCKDLKKDYDLLNFIDEVYDNASKYGEQFIYVVPYSTALSKLLSNKPNAIDAGMVPPIQESAIGNNTSEYMMTLDSKGFNIFSESKKVYHNNAMVIKESSEVIDKNGFRKTIDNSTGTYVPLMNTNENISMKIEICKSGIIESFIRETQIGYKNKCTMTESMASVFEQSIIHEDNKKNLVMVRKDKKTGKLSIDGLEKTMNSISSDGLVAGDANKKEENKEVKVKVPGCVIAKPRRENIIPVYMGTNNSCLGYYYLEFSGTSDNMDDAFQGFTNVMSDTLTTLRGSNSGVNAPFNNIEGSRQEEMIRYIAAQLSNFIDKEFVQNNQDLREELYMILKYNDLFNTPNINKMRITFVPPEDMIHVYFKMDKITHRGISDLDKAMIPAKIYATMYITDAIGHMVRGQDKRVFYVKQQVEQNIAKTLMNTIQQLKQGNFGLRQFQSINNVLNITGRFNDFLIPTSSSGDSPIEIQTIPGQQFTDNTEQMQQLREMAVNSTDVPFELIQTRQSIDYASQLSMANSKFLRKVFKRQSLYQIFLSRFITKLYNFEYGENLELQVQLPPPMFITMANTNQLIDNTKQYIQSVTELELAYEEDESVKTIYQDMLFRYYIGSHVDLSKHEAILKRAKLEASRIRKNEE